MRILLLVVLLLCLPFPASAQDKKDAGDKKDPQSIFEPRSKPGEGQKFLEKFVGEWEAAKTFYPRSGPPIQQKGLCSQVMIHDGRFLQSKFTFGQGDTKTTGTGTIGFEAASGLFTSVWTDSRSTRMSLRQSKQKFEGKEIVLFSVALPADGDKGRVSRTVTSLEDEGRKILHRQYTLGEGGKERLVMELILIRKDKKDREK